MVVVVRFAVPARAMRGFRPERYLCRTPKNEDHERIAEMWLYFMPYLL
jgi:hypothetical protein